MSYQKNLIIPGSNDKPIALDIFFEDAAKPQPVVIYAHGFNGFKDWGNFDLVANRFALKGLVLIKFNFSHNGTTPEHPEEFVDLEAFGKNNYSIQLHDLSLVIDWICDSANIYHSVFDLSKLSLIGHSLGGGIAILQAARDTRIKKLATWASISECKTPWGSWPVSRIALWKKEGVQYYTNTRTNQQMPMYYQLYEDYQQHEEELGIQKAIKNIKVPMLICHGTNDLSVPVENAYALKSWQPFAELFTLETDHVFYRKHPWPGKQVPPEMEAVIKETILFLS